MRKRKLLAFAMVFIMMFNLVSCSNAGAGDKTDQEKTEKTEQVKTNQTEQGETDQAGQENADQEKAGVFLAPRKKIPLFWILRLNRLR